VLRDTHDSYARAGNESERWFNLLQVVVVVVVVVEVMMMI